MGKGLLKLGGDAYLHIVEKLCGRISCEKKKGLKGSAHGQLRWSRIRHILRLPPKPRTF